MNAVSAPATHWVVRMNHRNRSVSWLMVFAIMCTHFREQALALPYWVAMAAQFLVYPHLVFLWARRAADPLAAEIWNMRLDALCFGVWGALLGFPLWICFPLLLCGCMNIAAFAAGRGVAQALAASAAGALLVEALGGARPFLPDTSLLVSALSMAALSIYLMLFALGAHHRTQKLHETRQQLRQSEAALQAQLQEIRSLQERLTEQATRDPLTGLYNRRYLDDSLQRELDRCARESAPLSLLLVDLDHFKQINDRHGHSAGDEALRRISALLLQHMRSSDICCRYGGEEFLLVLPRVGPEAAAERAERLRQRVAGLHESGDEGLGFALTLSVGLACSLDGLTPPATLIDQADRALYRAKADGRNRVIAAS